MSGKCNRNFQSTKIWSPQLSSVAKRREMGVEYSQKHGVVESYEEPPNGEILWRRAAGKTSSTLAII